MNVSPALLTMPYGSWGSWVALGAYNLAVLPCRHGVAECLVKTPCITRGFLQCLVNHASILE